MAQRSPHSFFSQACAPLRASTVAAMAQRQTAEVEVLDKRTCRQANRVIVAAAPAALLLTLFTQVRIPSLCKREWRVAGCGPHRPARAEECGVARPRVEWWSPRRRCRRP